MICGQNIFYSEFIKKKNPLKMRGSGFILRGFQPKFFLGYQFKYRFCWQIANP